MCGIGNCHLLLAQQRPAPDNIEPRRVNFSIQFRFRLCKTGCVMSRLAFSLTYPDFKIIFSVTVVRRRRHIPVDSGVLHHIHHIIGSTGSTQRDGVGKNAAGGIKLHLPQSGGAFKRDRPRTERSRRVGTDNAVGDDYASGKVVRGIVENERAAAQKDYPPRAGYLIGDCLR